MKNNTIIGLAIAFAIAVLCFIVTIPYFHPGYFPTHDGEWAVVRLTDMFRTLRDFQIPARYSGNLNFGYGYPLFNFTYPLPYYLGILVHLFGVGFVNTVKVLFAGSVFLSAFFMFLASRALWKSNWAGLVSSILYIYFPYRMVDLYVRGSIGESLSFAIFPLLLYLAIKLIEKFSFLLVGGIAVSVAFLVMTHNIMTVLFMPVYTIFILILGYLKNKKVIKSFFVSIILGFGLSAFFWIPAIFEKNNILLSQIPIANRSLYFVSLNQFVFPSWGYGIPTGQNGFSYQMGVVNLATMLIVIISLLFIFLRKKKSAVDDYLKIAGLLVIFILLYVFLLFKPSEFLWKNLPLLSEINYPWITLGILGFLVSLLAGLLCKQLIGRYVAIILGILAIITILPYAKPDRYINYPDSYYLTNDATTTSSNELMPLWVKKIPSQRELKKVEIISGNAVIDNVFFNSKKVIFSINASTKTKVRINTIFYPGWNVNIDRSNTEISYNNELGVMEVSVPVGNHIVQADFGETPLRMTSDIISVASILIISTLIFRRNKYATI
jgi:hypothetical protein